MNSFSREPSIPRLPMRALAPLLLLPSPISAQAARSLLAAAGLCHPNTYTDTHTRAPGHHGIAAAAVLCPSSPRFPPRLPLFMGSSKPFLPSFMCAVLLIEELGKHFRGRPPAGHGTAGLRTRGKDLWAAGLCSSPCRGPEGGKASVTLGPTGELAAADTSIPRPASN